MSMPNVTMAHSSPELNFDHSNRYAYPNSQLQLQFRNCFDLLFEHRSRGVTLNYIRPYIPNHIRRPEFFCDSLDFRRPRRTRTTFTSTQITELEQYYLQARYLTSSVLAELKGKLALGTSQIKNWFKNRRRRHKTQSYRPKHFLYGRLPLSFTVTNSAETNSINISHGSSLACGIPGSLNSLDRSNESIPNTLTISLSSTMPTADLIKYCRKSAFNLCYFNNNQTSFPSHLHHRSNHIPASPKHPYVVPETQYYKPLPSFGNFQHH